MGRRIVCTYVWFDDVHKTGKLGVRRIKLGKRGRVKVVLKVLKRLSIPMM